jgi:VWFA-related protein
MRRFITYAVVLLCVASVHAQEVRSAPDPSVVVDAIVTDAKGAPVAGLTKADFEVLEGGEAREIAAFSEAASGTAEGRRVMILFDNFTLTMPNRKLFAAAAREFVEKSLAPTDRVLVGSLLADAVVRQDWTTDRGAIIKAIDELAKETPIGRAEGQRRRLEQDIRSTRIDDAIGASGSRGSTVTFDSLTTAVRNYSSAVMQETAHSVHSLGGALRHFGRAPGRKIVIVAGEGLPLRPGADMWEYLESVRNDITGGAGSGSLQRSARDATPLGESSQFDVSVEIRSLAASARRGGVVFYPLNPGTNEKLSGGVENHEFVNTSSEFAKTAGQASGYQLLARETGGLAFGGAKPSLALERIARDLTGGYSLAYRSASPKPEALVVRAKGAHRTRYVVVGGAVPQDSIQDLVMAHHRSTPETNDLGVVLAADAPVADQGKRRVALKVQIPVKNLKFDREGNEVTGGFDVFISPGDARGTASAVTKQTQQLRWPADALPYLAEKSVTFAVDVVLEAGRDQISIGVVDPKSNRTGFAKISVP